MEPGSPQVAIGTWVKALDILEVVQELDNLIAPKKSLAERFETHQKVAGRQCVKRNR